jgi:ribosomal protein S1
MDTSVVADSDRPTEIKPKMRYTGTVVKVTLAGAIVDIGVGTPAVLHISQLQSAGEDQPIKRVEDAVQVGQEVEVWVKKVKEGRIELTMNKPLEHDWRDLKKGMVVKGKVVRLEKFGAFVEIGAERPGLIHISELAHGYVRVPSDVVKDGDDIEAQILDVNRRKKQIKLSLKALQPEPVKEEEPARLIENVQKDKASRRRRGKKSEDGGPADRGETGRQAEPAEIPVDDPTVMEIALREAMEKARERRKQDKGKRSKNVSREQEDILSRTLEQKLRTS